MWRGSDDTHTAETAYVPSAQSRPVRHVLRSRYPYEGNSEHLPGCYLCDYEARQDVGRTCFAGFVQICGVLLGMLVVYGAVLAAIGSPARIHGPVWCVCVVWMCAQAAGYLAGRVSMHDEWLLITCLACPQSLPKCLTFATCN